MEKKRMKYKALTLIIRQIKHLVIAGDVRFINLVTMNQNQHIIRIGLVLPRHSKEANAQCFSKVLFTMVNNSLVLDKTQMW